MKFLIVIGDEVSQLSGMTSINRFKPNGCNSYMFEPDSDYDTVFEYFESLKQESDNTEPHEVYEYIKKLERKHAVYVANTNLDNHAQRAGIKNVFNINGSFHDYSIDHEGRQIHDVVKFYQEPKHMKLLTEYIKTTSHFIGLGLQYNKFPYAGFEQIWTKSITRPLDAQHNSRYVFSIDTIDKSELPAFFGKSFISYISRFI